MVAFFVPPAGFQRNGPRLTWLGSSSNALGTTTISFGDFTAQSDGLLVVLLTCFATDNRNTDSVSIGGTNGTLHATNGVSTRKVAVASRAVSAGTHNVTVVLGGANGGAARNFCGCWLLTDYASATPPYALHSYASSTASVGQTHDIPRYAVALYHVSETDSLPTWTSAAIDGFEDPGPYRSYWASRRVTRQEIGHTETATYAGSGTHLLLTGAVWA